MSASETIKDVREHPFLREFPEDVVDRLVQLATIREYEAGARLCREGDLADRFFLILDGGVAVELHAPHAGKRRIQTLGAGDAVGWSWIVPPYRWQFDVITTQRSRVAEFDAGQLRELCDREHTVGYLVCRRLLEVLARRLAGTRLQLLDLYA